MPENNCTEIFEKVDQAPNFEGGDQGFMKYNEEHIFPMIAKSQNGVAKNMEFQYKMIVSKTGRIVDCEISSPFSKDLAEKVKSQIYEMPPWNPAVSNGEPVCFQLVIPMELRLMKRPI